MRCSSLKKASQPFFRPIAAAVVVMVVAVVALTSIAWAAEQQPLVFGGNAHYPPITCLENGKPKGLVVDIVRALELRMRRPIDIRLMEWKDAQTQVLEGQIDALAPMTVTGARKKLYDFSESMYEVRVSIFVRRGKVGISSLADLRGMRVGVTDGGLAMQLVQADPEIRMVAMGDDLLHVFQMLRESKLDAVVADYWVGHYLLTENKITDIQSLGGPDTRMASSIAVKKGNTALLSAINAGIKSLKADGTLARIQAKWEPKEIVIQTREQELQKTYSVVIGFLMVLLMAGSIWIITMRREIVRRRNAEADARESEARFSALIEQAPDAIVVYDVDLDCFVTANAAAEILFGCSRTELIQKSPAQFYAQDQPDNRDGNQPFDLHNEQALAGKVVESERAVRSTDGSVRLCEVRLISLPFKGRRLIRASFIDITERKRLAVELKNNKLELQGVLDNSPALIYMKDITGRYRFVNRCWTTLFHTTSDDVKGKTDLDFFPKEFALKFMANDQQVITEGQTIEFEELFRHEDGMHYYQSFKAPLKDINGTTYALCGISTDITEHKRLEEQLHQSQKMESIGRLAGGVAHDFNNMLSVILGAAQLAMPKAPDGGELWQLLDVITAAAVRSSGITRQLLAFSRKEAIVPRAIDLNAHVAEAEKSLGRLIGEDIHFSFHPAADLWRVKMDPSQVDQILMNLSVNARDAMQGGGSLIMETTNVHIDGDYSHSHLDAQPGDYALLTVSDTGCGMDSETRKRIFEPFFTTKAIGEGTGLGLSTVYGIVTQNDGFITCYSELGQGTTFYIYLPRLTEGEVVEEEAAPAARTGTETILLVEDEEMLIGIATKLLEQLGYTVIQAQSPQAAISICEEKNRHIDMILTDVIMPEMNGKQMIDKIKLIRPEIKVMFMSGYTADIVARRGIVEEGTHYIQKPLEMHRLQEKIGKVLRDGGATTAESPAVLRDAASGAHLETALPEYLTDDSEVIDLFIAKAPEYVSHMQIGARDGDFEKMRFFSHKLRGAAVAIGCHSIADIAGALEEMSGPSEPNNADQSLGQLSAELERLLTALKARH